MKTDDEYILEIARALFIRSNNWSGIIRNAARKGAYDNGDWIQRHMAEARDIHERSKGNVA